MDRVSRNDTKADGTHFPPIRVARGESVTAPKEGIPLGHREGEQDTWPVGGGQRRGQPE